MNIHFTDDHLFNEFFGYSLFDMEVGSSMYGLKTPASDSDILVIYADSILNPLINRTHHQLQYNTAEENYIFTSFSQFIHNILSGDSTINYEVLKHPKFKEQFPSLSKLPIFDNVNVVKSYLGMAKRDIKMYRKSKDIKKAYHIARGILFAEAILMKRDIFEVLEENRGLLTTFRNVKADDRIIDDYENKMNRLRESIKNEVFVMSSDDAFTLEQEMFEVMKKVGQPMCYPWGKLIVEAIYDEKFNY